MSSLVFLLFLICYHWQLVAASSTAFIQNPLGFQNHPTTSSISSSSSTSTTATFRRPPPCANNFFLSSLSSSSSSSHAEKGQWIDLVHGKKGAVKKLVLQEGIGPLPCPGSDIEIAYVGKLGESQIEWSVDDVIESWLQFQQGLNDILQGPFRDNQIDGEALFDESKFTEEFVTNELGVMNKIQCKKTIMAAKRLRKQIDEFPQGFEFDSSLKRQKTYSFTLGKEKVIKAMDLAVSTMKVGEKAQMICRCDYGYGSEGYRTTKGDVVVPPFRTLVFDIELLSASN